MEAILADKVRACQTAYLRSKRTFDAIINALDQFPHSGIDLKFRNVAGTHISAVQAYTKALGEHSRFMASGTIPDQFKE
jgi:hypothetical protein